MKTCNINGYWYILSNRKPKHKECYVSISTDSIGVKLYAGVRLESDKNQDSHKNCIAILATDNPGLNKEGCPNLDGYKIG